MAPKSILRENWDEYLALSKRFVPASLARLFENNRKLFYAGVAALIALELLVAGVGYFLLFH